MFPKTKSYRAGARCQDTEERRQTEALQEMVSVVKGAVSAGAGASEASRAPSTLTPNQKWGGVSETRLERIDEEVCVEVY